jgi:hypothetical protein
MRTSNGVGIFQIYQMNKPIPQYLLASARLHKPHRRESSVIFVTGCAVGVFLVLILHSLLNF